jgi:hypothetical protein
LNDPKLIQAPWLSKQSIQEKVDEFRKNFPRADKIPVNVEHIIEFDLRLKLCPVAGLMDDCGKDALLLSDGSVIVDLGEFEQDRFRDRLRFSLAHEIGHYVLHSDLYKGIKFNSVDEWIEFIQGVPEQTYDWIEYQANEFAGRLLIPSPELREQFSLAVAKLKGTPYEGLDPLPEPVVMTIARSICGRFSVSYKPVLSRIQREQLWRKS